MSDAAMPAPRSAAASTDGARRLGPGWPTIAAKEFADHVLSARFYVLLIILGVAALIPLYFAAEQIKNAASSVSGAQAIFLFLFTVGPQDISLLRVDQFVGIAAPLLGVAFAFDAINGERHEGTLPRLLSQPIHRDDVINGKFVAGLAVISLVLGAVVLVISGFGLLRLGIVPEVAEIVRIVGWYLLTVLYVALWLAFGMLLSVVISRAATSALVGLGVWLFVAVPIFGQLIVSIVGGFVAPGGSTAQDILSAASAQQFLLRLLPSTLYSEASVVLLDPSVTTVSTPTLGQYVQAQQQVPTLLSLDQSVLLVWPHIVALLALTVLCFALAYVSFMRQEVRA
jgi:ABC-2 type transport system permease protein